MFLREVVLPDRFCVIVRFVLAITEKGIWKYRYPVLSRHRLDQLKRSGALVPLSEDHCFIINLFSFCWHTEGSHGEIFRDLQPNYDIFHSWCQGLFRPQVLCTPSLHYPIANSASTQYRMANPIYLTLRASNSTQAMLELSSIQVLTELNIAWLQW